MTATQFEAVFTKLKDKLYRYAFRYVQDPVVAEDVLQDVMVKLWQKRDELEGIDNLEAWLMVMTRNRALDIWRQQKHEIVDLDSAAQLSSPQLKPDQELEQSDFMKQLHAALNQLPEKGRNIFHLREIEQMSYDEISKQTGYSIDDVKVSLFRARKQVQRILIHTNQYQLHK